MGATHPAASVLLVGVVGVLVAPCCSSALHEPINNHQLSRDSMTSSELILSMVVNQMTLLRMLNQSSTSCSLYDAAITEINATQTDAKEELRHNLEMALLTMQEKKEEMLDEITEKKEQTETELASIKESALNELTDTRKLIKEELNATREAMATSNATQEDAMEELRRSLEMALMSIQQQKEEVLTETRQQVNGTIAKVMPRKLFLMYIAKSNHSEAMDACKQKGSRLAVPENEEEDDQLKAMINTDTAETKENKVFWIGVDDKEEENVWVNSNTGLNNTFINFGRGQPQPERDEDCVAVWKNDAWHDFPCKARLRGYLCEITVAVV